MKYIRFSLPLLVLLLTGPVTAISQDIPFSEKFFPGRSNELKIAIQNLARGDEFFLTGKPALFKNAISFYEAANTFNNSNAEFTIQIISAENNEQINNTVIENHKYYFEILKDSPVNITSKH